MKISYNWLQTYFKERLPAPQELAELITFHAFEIEGVEQAGIDTILDVKVLPDRAHYALSHLGIAREVAFIIGQKLNDRELAIEHTAINESQELIIDIQDNRCIRDTKMVIKNVNVGPSPQWLQDWLKAFGQRSISNVVDATNFVMFDRGQPLHAFDMDKLTKKDGKVKIVLKKAGQDLKITTLGGKEYQLDSDMLIFADGYNNDLALDIAGIKGGTAAEVDVSTKNLVVLSANFDASYIRKVSTKLGIRTDASKRSENRIPVELTKDGLLHATELIMQIAGSESVQMEGMVDYYPHKITPHEVAVTTEYIRNLLGLPIEPKEIEDILLRLECTFNKKGDTYHITPPTYRLDLLIPQDFVEEIGRLYDYRKIPNTQLPEGRFAPTINKSFYYANVIRDVLVSQGFSEVYTYSLTNKGAVEIQNPLASDKNFLRSNLTEGITKSLDLNAKHTDLLGVKQIKIFEIGNVFTKEGEHTSFALGIRNTQKQKVKEAEELKDVLQLLGSELVVDLAFAEIINGAAEINFDNIVRGLPEPAQGHEYQVSAREKMFKPVSVYPFAVRDIAVFTPEGTTEHEVRSVIGKYGKAFLVKEMLFDVFEKAMPDGTKKISYAFRLVFQSHEKTLTEEEINWIMKGITDEMNGKEGWQVR